MPCYTQKPISLLILDSVKLATNTNYCENLEQN